MKGDFYLILQFRLNFLGLVTFKRRQPSLKFSILLRVINIQNATQFLNFANSMINVNHLSKSS